MKILIAIFGLLCITASYRPSVVATVDGEPVDSAELQFEMSEQRTAVYSYFAWKFKLGEEPLIWTKSYRGEIPLKLLRKNALEKAIIRKVLQIQMKKYGLQRDISFSGFRLQFESSVRLRKKDTENGKVTYGPPELTPQRYYLYFFDNQVNALKALLYDRRVIPPNGYGSWLKQRVKRSKVILFPLRINRIQPF